MGRVRRGHLAFRGRWGRLALGGRQIRRGRRYTADAQDRVLRPQLLQRVLHESRPHPEALGEPRRGDRGARARTAQDELGQRAASALDAPDPRSRTSTRGHAAVSTGTGRHATARGRTSTRGRTGTWGHVGTRTAAGPVRDLDAEDAVEADGVGRARPQLTARDPQGHRTTCGRERVEKPPRRANRLLTRPSGAQLNGTGRDRSAADRLRLGAGRASNPAASPGVGSTSRASSLVTHGPGRINPSAQAHLGGPNSPGPGVGGPSNPNRSFAASLGVGSASRASGLTNSPCPASDPADDPADGHGPGSPDRDLAASRVRAVAPAVGPCQPPGHLRGRQRSELAQQVGNTLGVGARPPPRGEPLELGLDPGQDTGVEKLGDPGVAHESGNRVRVQGQQAGAALGVRQVLLVEQGGRVPEQERVGEGRGNPGRRLDHAHRPRGDPLHEGGQGGQVVDVLEALARRLQGDGEVAELSGGLQELPGLDALEPQGRAVPRRGPRHEQGAGGALAEAGGEQGGLLDPRAHEPGQLVGVEGDELGSRGGGGRGQLEDDPVVGDDDLRLNAEAAPHALADAHGPGLVDAPPEGAVEDEAQAAALVLAALQHQDGVGGEDAGGRPLLAQQGNEVGPGAGVQASGGQAAHEVGRRGWSVIGSGLRKGPGRLREGPGTSVRRRGGSGMGVGLCEGPSRLCEGSGGRRGGPVTGSGLRARLGRLREGSGDDGADDTGPHALDQPCGLAQEGALGGPGGGGAAGPLAPPEGQAGAAAGGGVDDDTVGPDLAHPPAGGAQRNNVADGGLVDHLLVELAHAAPPAVLGALGQDDGEGAAVGDGAGGGDGGPLGAGPGGERAGVAVPCQARGEVGQVRGGEAAAEQLQDGVEGGPRQLGVGGGAADGGVPGVGVKVLDARGRNGLLGEDVQGIGHQHGALNGAGAHALGGDDGVDELGTLDRVDGATGPPADAVVGAAHALQAAGDRGRGRDLEDNVDGAHVDAELE